MAIWSLPASLWNIARRIETLIKLQDTTSVALETINTRLRNLEERITRLELDQDRLVAEARSAAGVAATGLAGSVIADVVTRLTRVEMRQDDVQRRLTPPA